MIYYICALQCEAVPFIHRLKLKKNMAYTHMDVFENESSTVVVTGTGLLKSAMSVTELLTSANIGDKDFIVNVGICGYIGSGNILLGTAFMCNSIEAEYNGRKYYPDMIYESPFEECKIITCNNVVTDSAKDDEYLTDMEAAGVYESAIRFVKTSQIAFIKIVSDYCDGNYPSKEEAEGYIGRNADTIIEWAENVQNQLRLNHKEVLTSEEIFLMNETADRLRYSVTKRHLLKNQLIYEKIVGKDIMELMKNM